MFCGPGGRTMTIEQYRAMFYSALDACGVDNPLEGPEGAKRHRYTPHSCRHTFATLMKRVTVQTRTNWSSSGTRQMRCYGTIRTYL